MNKGILFEIKNNKEIDRIYLELKRGFLAFIQVTIPMLRQEDCEEIYNDSFLAVCENISSGKLNMLTCSLQTYINQIGKNKSISYLRSKEYSQIVQNYDFEQCRQELDYIADSEDEIMNQKQEEVYLLVKEMQNETCRKLLFGFYWNHYSMEMLAKLINANSADVAKTTKNRCLTKLKNIAFSVFRKKGLI